MLPALTRRQRELLEHLQETESTRRSPPTLDEVCAELGLKSRGSLHKHVQALIDCGLVEPAAGRQRGIRLISNHSIQDATDTSQQASRQDGVVDFGPTNDYRSADPAHLARQTNEGAAVVEDNVLSSGTETAENFNEDQIPLLGKIAAGRPIEAIESAEALTVPSWLRSSQPCFALQVRGDSMMDDGILDGDWVVVEHRSHARNGEVVVALVDGEEATLKRIEQREGVCTLHPANQAYEPIVLHPEQVTIQGVVVAQMRRYA